MSLIPYDPFRQLENMRKDLNSMFSQDFSLNRELTVPRVDIYETDNEVVATCDIPGLESQDDVVININDDTVLTISGTINRTKETNDKHVHRQERYSGQFQRSMSLPSPVSEENVKATYKNGVLEVRMPKLKDHHHHHKKINIEFH